MRLLAGLALTLVIGASAQAAEYSGPAEVVESDIISIGDQRIMLYGVDGIEPRQTCEINRQEWECWAAAVRQLQTIVSEGPVTCEQVGSPDPHGRVLANCTVNGEDIAERYIRSGFAVAVAKERPELADLEKEAKKEKIGLWQGRFLLPRDWRMSHGIFVDRP